MAEKATKWYAVHTISGKECKVKEYLEAEILKEKSLLREHVTQALSPTEKKLRLSADGKKKLEKDVLLFPGYVFIEAYYTKELPSLLHDNIPYILSFVGNPVTKEPIPLTEAEVRRLKSYETDFELPDDSGVSFQIGETVKITVDPFNGSSGVVEEVFDDRKKLRVAVMVFGRSTPMELGFNQVEKE